VRLTWRIEERVLARPFRISRATMDRRQAIVVAFEHDGLAGHGEVVTSAYYDQSLRRIEDSLRDVAGRTGVAADPFAMLAVVDELIEASPARAWSVAAVDAAVHDWIGRRLELPLHRVLGLPTGEDPRTALSIGIADPDEVGRAAAEAARCGFTVLKLKVGLSGPDQEREMVGAARRAAPAATILLDANGGWSAEEAVSRLQGLAPFGPALVEQPIPPGRPDLLARVAERSPVPVFADEDAVGPPDVARLWGAVHGINVKPQRCGGVRQALRMIHAARAGGLRVMLGCHVASGLGIAPAAHLAGAADHLDLDGHLLLADDPWRGLDGGGGRLLLGGPGLGVRRRS
jgi:L-alanine-DL-glutamate epimerase-like enolase superfamily enzyme